VTPSIAPSDWLRFIDKEYLETFVRDGGSSIKFAVPSDDAVRPELFDGLTRLAQEGGYPVVTISAVDTKIHMADEIFFRTAQQVPWQVISRKFLSKIAAELGYAWPDTGDGSLALRLAEKNQVDPKMLSIDFKKAIANKVLKEGKLSRDFRVAMTHLCLAELSGGQEGETTLQILTDWLTGRNRAVSAVKPYHIFRRIARTNARFFFESMVRWLRAVDYPGLVILLDNQRIMQQRKPEDPGLFYSKAAVMDAYEVLRKFIDDADNLEGFFMVVIPDPGFLEDLARGLNSYAALKHRVIDEVHDRNLVNPLASLARIRAAT